MRILVAEDDAPLAEFLQERLEQEQFAVQVVSSGAEAQQLASDQAYDLLSSPQDGFGIRPRLDSNDPWRWLSDRRKRPARLEIHENG